MNDRGCCCCTLETCVKVQGVVVASVCAGNIARVLWKAADQGGGEAPPSPIKQTSVGAYLDGLDLVVNGLGGLLLFAAAVAMLRGIRQRRPALLQPYLAVAAVEAVALAFLAIVYGVAAAQSLAEPRPDRLPDEATISVGEIGAIVVATLLLLIAFPTYFLLNVSSLYDYMSSDHYRMEHFYYIGT